MTWGRTTWDQDRWRDRAACANVDPAVFFPIGVSQRAAAMTHEAKSICSQCPVTQECLIFAVTTNQEHGVWGGLDEDERREVRRSWRRASKRAASTQRA